ncbi:MAG: elongation factor P--(R)-beta-lysine ligase [Candidatus Pelagadaptatus aseana]|uniref:EF-P lysine aminoacylase EpmA n=1 Tax=Candidatus Pelagadaptatus aseana TaxID=3120508 RepID=UPI0039B28633
MPDLLWKPGASLQTLQARAELYRQIRDYFRSLDVLEVDVPVVANTAGTDPHIDLIPTQTCQQQNYLQSSPEFFMKRLLAAGSGDIFSLGKAFRNEEYGRRHNPEFTMLEWYRLGLDDRQLASEVCDLITATTGIEKCQLFSYRDLFEQKFQINPHQTQLTTLKHLAGEHCNIHWQDDNPDTWLDLLMTHVIEPTLPQGISVIFDYPASQAALARTEISAQGDLIARRFEIYLNGMELANGYWELTDAQEQAERFEQDLNQRQAMNNPAIPVDQHLLSALKSGLPDCAGVALGVDRLVMAKCNLQDMDQAQSFSFKRI